MGGSTELCNRTGRQEKGLRAPANATGKVSHTSEECSHDSDDPEHPINDDHQTPIKSPSILKGQEANASNDHGDMADRETGLQSERRKVGSEPKKPQSRSAHRSTTSNGQSAARL